jgi:hypothetical protein
MVWTSSRVGFCRDKYQGGVIGAVRDVSVYSVVAQIDLTANEPLGERRIAVITDGIERLGPFNQVRLLTPKGLGLLN